MPDTKRIDEAKVIAVIEAEQNLMHGELVEADHEVGRLELMQQYGENSFELANVMAVKKCDSPGHCAVGALLFAAGMSNRELLALPASAGAWVQMPGSDRHELCQKARETLYKEYGLRIYHADRIISANDSDDLEYDSNGVPIDDQAVVMQRRQREVIERVRELARMQRENPDYDWVRVRQNEQF